jgi:hypothetical protein
MFIFILIQLIFAVNTQFSFGKLPPKLQSPRCLPCPSLDNHKGLFNDSMSFPPIAGPAGPGPSTNMKVTALIKSNPDPYHFLLDSGSAWNLIPLAHVKSHKLLGHFSPSPVKTVAGFNGSTSPVHGQVELDCCVYDSDGVVVHQLISFLIVGETPILGYPWIEMNEPVCLWKERRWKWSKERLESEDWMGYLE